MGLLTRVLAALPRNMLFPVVAVMAGWYGGAKYGAPDYLLNSIDGTVKQGIDMIGGLIGGGENQPAEDNSAEGNGAGTEGG
ncbi:MAG: hypothetical protein DHS20C05_20320 [Hyphococcus sp.]|nr:MAG: hypothetical protein DHS20C05_20320 [Marinicaulis sp.]